MQQIIQKHHSGGSGGRASRQTIRRWINPDLHLSVCRSILRQDTEPRVAPDVTVSFISTARVSNKVDQSALQDKTTDQYNKYSRIKHKTNKMNKYNMNYYYELKQRQCNIKNLHTCIKSTSACSTISASPTTLPHMHSVST